MLAMQLGKLQSVSVAIERAEGLLVQFLQTPAAGEGVLPAAENLCSGAGAGTPRNGVKRAQASGAGSSTAGHLRRSTSSKPEEPDVTADAVIKPGARVPVGLVACRWQPKSAAKWRTRLDDFIRGVDDPAQHRWEHQNGVKRSVRHEVAHGKWLR
jgi:hypothetical protein